MNYLNSCFMLCVLFSHSHIGFFKNPDAKHTIHFKRPSTFCFACFVCLWKDSVIWQGKESDIVFLSGSHPAWVSQRYTFDFDLKGIVLRFFWNTYSGTVVWSDRMCFPLKVSQIDIRSLVWSSRSWLTWLTVSRDRTSIGTLDILLWDKLVTDISELSNFRILCSTPYKTFKNWHTSTLNQGEIKPVHLPIPLPVSQHSAVCT